jgi:hypothetical protein
MSPFASEPRYAVARSPMVIPSGREAGRKPYPIRKGLGLGRARQRDGECKAEQRK